MTEDAPFDLNLHSPQRRLIELRMTGKPTAELGQALAEDVLAGSTQRAAERPCRRRNRFRSICCSSRILQRLLFQQGPMAQKRLAGR